MKKGVFVLVILFLITINLGFISGTEYPKSIGDYSLNEFKNFNKTYPNNYILSKEKIIYEKEGNEVIIEIIQYNSSEYLIKKLREAFSYGLEIGFDGDSPYFIYEGVYGWTGNNYSIQIIGMDDFEYSDQIVNYFLNKIPINPKVMNNNLINSFNTLSKSNIEVFASTCSELGYSSCSDLSNQFRSGNTRYECNSFGWMWGIKPYCWEPVANEGDPDFCTTGAKCGYSQGDCDLSSQCESNFCAGLLGGSANDACCNMGNGYSPITGCCVKGYNNNYRCSNNKIQREKIGDGCNKEWKTIETCSSDETCQNNVCVKNAPDVSDLTYQFGNIKYGLYRKKWNPGICIACSSSWSSREIDYTKRPVLLIHGWSNGNSIIEEDTKNEWGNLQEELENNGYQVWRLQYSPANSNAPEISGMIDDSIENLLSYGYDNNFDKIDVVAHSLGGLATRGYIQGMAKDKYGNSIFYGNNIRKQVFLASPMGGSFFANIIDGITNFNIETNHPYCEKFIKGDYIGGKDLTGKTDATKDMQIGSDYTWELNIRNFNSNVEYLTISGRKTLDGATPLIQSMRYCLSNGWEINDGVVSLYSSNLINKNYPLVILDNFHSSIKIPLVGTAGIDTSLDSGKLIDLFLRNSLNLNTASNILNNNLGEIYYDPSSSQSLPFQLDTGGGIVVDIKNSEINENSFKLKPLNSNSGYLMTQNSWTERWFYLTSSDSTNNYMLFSNILPSQYYIPVINNFEYPGSIYIEDGVPNMVEINLDNDNDNYDLKTVGGSDCNDQDPNINPNADEKCNNIDDDCDDNIDETFYDKGNICYEGIGECKRLGEMICTVDETKTECNAISGSPIQEICDDDLDNDCDGLVDYEDKEDCIIDSLCTISSPIPSIYSFRRIPFDIQAIEKLAEIKYIDYSDSRPRWKRLCSKCDEYDKEKSFREGNHNVKIECIPYVGEPEIHEINFINDYKSPRISKTLPSRNKFADGNFEVQLKEDNLANITLHYGNEEVELDLEQCYEERGKRYCSVEVNLSDYNNQEISYYFEVEDIAGNVVESKKTKVKVDTVAPVVLNPDDFFEIDGRYVYFDILVNELNFDEVVLNYEYRGKMKEKRLCSRLKEGRCEKKFRFKEDYTNLKIVVRDEAGNEVELDVV